MADASNEIQAILDIRVEADKAIQEIGKYEAEIKKLKDEQKKLNQEYNEGAISAQEYGEQYAALKVQTKELGDASRALQKELRNQNKVDRENEGSLKSLRAELSNLTKQYDELSRAEREGAAGKELQEKINATTKELKDAEEATTRYYRNVGNYKNSIEQALGANNKWVKSAQMMKSVMSGGVSNAFKGATEAVGSFGKKLLGLLANPIVAMLAAIALAISAVIKGIKSSEENTRSLQRLMAPFKAVLTQVLKVIQDATSWLLKMAENAGKLAEKLGLVTDKMKEEIALTKEQQALEDATRAAIVNDAKAQRDIARLRNEASQKDKYSAEERLKRLQQADALEKGIMERELQRAKQALDIAKRRAAQAQNDKQANEELAQAQARVYQAETNYYEGTIRLQRQMATARQEIANEGKKEVSENAKNREAGLQNAKKASEERIKIKQEELQKEREAIRTAEDAIIANIHDELERRRAEINASYSRQIADLQMRLESEKNLTIDARNAIQTTIIELGKAQETELDKLSEERLQKELERRQKEIDAIIKQSEADNKAAEDAIKKRFEIQSLQTDDELERLRLRMEERKAILDNAHILEGEAEEDFELRMLQMKEEYANARNAVAAKEVQIEQTKYEAIANVMNGVSQVMDAFGEDSKAAAQLSKVLALAEIAINIGAAIAKMTSAEAGKGIAGIATTAAGIANIMAQMAAAIKLVKSAKFAHGGLVQGEGTATSDSINARLSNGESVINARSTSLFAPLLSAFNQLGGGVPIVTVNNESEIGEDMLARAVAKGVMAMPHPVVGVTDIVAANNRVEVLDKISTI